MTQDEIKVVLDKHLKWLNNEVGGEKANLKGADLNGADLRHSDLCSADLKGANLNYADLSGANLSNANMDYSCFPLWCGGTNFKADPKLAAQLAYHICTLDFGDKTEEIRSKFKDLANTSHVIEKYNLKKID